MCTHTHRHSAKHEDLQAREYMWGLTCVNQSSVWWCENTQRTTDWHATSNDTQSWGQDYTFFVSKVLIFAANIATIASKVTTFDTKDVCALACSVAVSHSVTVVLLLSSLVCSNKQPTCESNIHKVTTSDTTRRIQRSICGCWLVLTKVLSGDVKTVTE